MCKPWFPVMFGEPGEQLKKPPGFKDVFEGLKHVFLFYMCFFWFSSSGFGLCVSSFFGSLFRIFGQLVLVLFSVNL